MKLRGVISEQAALREFMNLGIGISKLSKDCVLRLTENKINFIASEDAAGTKEPHIWCELPVAFFFKEYVFSGASDQQNEIFLEFEAAQFARALSTLKQHTICLKIKLTNMDTPSLSFVIEQSAADGVSREYVHDIPVEVISRKLWDDYREPQCTDFHVSIQLPNLKSVKHVVNQMKNVSPYLTLMANRTGRLTLKTTSDVVNLSVHFPDLPIESFDVGSLNTGLDETQEEYIAATIDGRKFLHFLTGMQVTNCLATCSIVQSRMVKLHIEQDMFMLGCLSGSEPS